MKQRTSRRSKGDAKALLFGAELEVRIHLPPAESPLRTRVFVGQITVFGLRGVVHLKPGTGELLHVLRRRMEYPELKRAVVEQAHAFNANVVLIEDKASGTQLIQELVEHGLHAVTRYEPQSDKNMRMHAQTAVIETALSTCPRGRLARRIPPRTDELPQGQSTTTRSTRPHSCSTGSKEPAARMGGIGYYGC